MLRTQDSGPSTRTSDEISGLGSGTWESGIGIQLRTKNPGTGSQDSESRIQDLRVQDSGPLIQNLGSRTHRIQNLGSRTQDLGSRTQNVNPGTSASKREIQGSEFRTQDFALKTLNSGLRIQDSVLRTHNLEISKGSSLSALCLAHRLLLGLNLSEGSTLALALLLEHTERK